MDVVIDLHSEQDTGLSTNEDDFGPNVNKHDTCGGDQERQNTCGVDVVCKSVNWEPQSGLVFETKEAAYAFYREYARSIGFGITIKASRRSKRSGKFIDVKIACSRFGSKREGSESSTSRSCIKTDCKAGMHMKRTQDEKWIIHSFVREHNHETCPEDFYGAVRGRHKKVVAAECQKKGLQAALDGDDVQVMLENFMLMQAEGPNFFYAIDLDGEKLMRSVFWVDAKGRSDYGIFCDVVFFDTYYVKSRYRIPFVPIFGVNNHFQLILLGCALLGEQTTSAFVWLMRTWLKAMGGQVPNVIITDQDKSLNEAVQDVFPGTRHCYSLWHMLSRVPTNLKQNELFTAKFNKCIYGSCTVEQFEKRWQKMVTKFKIREDDWVHSLYGDRAKWAPTYMQGTLLAGMSTKERSGSVASFFDNYIHKEATLKEFMEQYKSFLKDNHEMEAKADLETLNKEHALGSCSAFERQMLTIYTRALYEKFQVEVLGAISCHLQKEGENGATVTFRVDDSEERLKFLVSWNQAELGIHCSCHLFEYRGFLCKHAILVLQISGASNIPPYYILKRWTKDGRLHETVPGVAPNLQFRVQRFHNLCKRTIKLGEEGSLSQEAYAFAFQALEEALENCLAVNNSVSSVLEPNTYAVHGVTISAEEKNSSNVARSSRKRTVIKKKKVQSEGEGLTTSLQGGLEQEQINTRIRNNKNCYVPQHDEQEMEQRGSVSQIHGSYFDQQSLTNMVMGQPAFRAPLIPGFFGSHDGLQEMSVERTNCCTQPDRRTNDVNQQSGSCLLSMTGKM